MLRLSDVRLQSVMLMACSASFLLLGYEIVRSVSNSLFKNAWGTENLPVVMTLIPFVLLPVLYIYNKSLSRFGAARTYLLSGFLSCGTLLTCFFAIKTGSRLATGALFLVRESYVILIIEQIWSFINSTIDQNEARKVNGLVLSVTSVGAILGGFGVHFLAGKVGTLNLLLVACVLFIPTIAAGSRAYRLSPVPDTEHKKKPGSATDYLGLSLFREQKILFLILFMVISSQAFSALTTLNFQASLQEAYPVMDEQTAVSGFYFGVLHSLSLFFQLVGAPVLLSAFSLSTLHIAIPVLHMVSALMVVLFPGLWTAGFALLMFKSVDYSVFRAAKEILYIPLSYDARYRAKELIDVFGYRFSKSGTSLGISFLQKAGLSLDVSGYGLASVVAAGAWLLCILPVSRRQSYGEESTFASDS